MTRDHDEKIRVLFEQAVELDRTERDAFLDRIDGDPKILAEVRALLSARDEDTGFLEEQWFDSSRIQWDGLFGDDLDSGERLVGQRIGSYQIQAVLGAGGMGVVYRAEQEKPKRIVALKIIRPGFLSADALRRFEYEVSILGRLQHPGIAQIFDSGTAEAPSGVQPFFAMEFIEGLTLLEFVRRRRLTSRERIQLFTKICDAVQHAHQKGVIHRDLKPGNILVSESGQPKILDFGVARATDSDLQTTTVHTAVGQIIGTAHYMSPEQAVGDPAELDTRSDVYSLGVLLYELLTETLPYDLRGKFMHEVVRVIREDPPTAIGLKRSDLRGDVETVVGKALEKEKSRRYLSAAALADDLLRFLHDEPIMARPPSTVYQLKKFAQRNTALVTGVVTTFLALVIGLVTTYYFYREAKLRAKEAGENEVQALANEALAVKRLEDFVLRDDIYRLRELLDRANELWPAYPERVEPLEEWLEEAGELLSRRQQHRASLDRLREGAMKPDGPDGRRFDDTAQQRQHDAIVSHLSNLDELEVPNDLLFAGYGLNYGAGIARDEEGNYISECNVYRGLRDAVERRLDLALVVWEESLDEYQGEWDAAIESIADPGICPKYGGMRISPQIGLVPIGRNPQSGLWEFAHIWSGSIPEVDADGQVVMAEDTGIVLVLVPGGRAVLGTDEFTNVDGLDKLNESPVDETTVHAVQLNPFFISKYEMTQAQWFLCAGTNPSTTERGPLYPVQYIQWWEADLLLTRIGLDLPTEAQWEYAAHGGTTSLWLCGNDPICMEDYANVYDFSAREQLGHVAIVPPIYDDGFGYMAPVGSFRANDFGLHDICGNVWEWCKDTMGAYQLFDPRPGDGLRTVKGSSNKVFRGGGFRHSVDYARPSFRSHGSPDARDDDSGLRPARVLEL